MRDPHIEQLADHLYELDNLAERIIANPQAHIDALVKAGVLQMYVGPPTNYPPDVPHYVLVQPHTHEWRVWDARWDHLGVACVGCHRRTAVPNRLPIEVPE